MPPPPSPALPLRPLVVNIFPSRRGVARAAQFGCITVILPQSRLGQTESVLSCGPNSVRGAKAVDAYFDERDAYYAACESGDGVGGTNEIFVVVVVDMDMPYLTFRWRWCPCQWWRGEQVAFQSSQIYDNYAITPEVASK